MGLYMYLEGRKSFYPPKKQEDGFDIKGVTLALGYWRKHPNLHGYIVKEFAEGGVDDCNDIHLSVDDLKQIIAAVQDESLPYTEGFFFGTSTNSKKQRAQDIAIFAEALKWCQQVKAFEFEKVNVGAGMTAIKVDADTEIPTEYRDVVYRASW